MPQKTRRRTSLRSRLIIGVSLMLVPLTAIAIGSFWSFEQAVATFEKNESKRLEELFPLARLEELLMQTSNLVSDADNYSDWGSYNRFVNLNQETEQTFTLILNAPSQLTEKKRLVLSIQREWQQAKVKGEYLWTHSTSQQSGLSRQQQQQLKYNLQQAINGCRRLNDLLTNFQIEDNLEKVQALKQRVRTIIFVTSILAVSMAIASGLVLAQSILKPLNLLNQGVARFGKGDLSYRINLTTQDELEQLAHKINWMAAKLEQSQKALTELATIDGLTSLFNRREFNRRLTIELERSRRERHPVSLLMVDIDHFKPLNDTHGHQSGDDALRQISALIKKEVRPGDQAARYGGEEFAVILPYADSKDALVVAERLRLLIADQDIIIQNGQTIGVTASLGCATFPVDADSEETLMAEADRALYRAKQGGRNRVCLTSEVLAQRNL
jgi:diguanylate cyclase (GGDEF)-like protein